MTCYDQRRGKDETHIILTQSVNGELKKDTVNRMRRVRRKVQRPIRGRRKEKRKGRDGEAGNPGPEQKRRLRIQQANITNMDKNCHALIRSDADVIGIAEHKLRGESLKKWKETLREAKRKSVLGSCEEEGKVPKGGVGFIIKDNLTVVESQIRTENFKKAYEQGLLAKCEVDYGAKENIHLDEIYGCS